ncbi:hypothetical protein P8452_25889 [Trifolium repens]|nr:hypothetical protein P8452_25889 [Trifolium repens]
MRLEGVFLSAYGLSHLIITNSIFIRKTIYSQYHDSFLNHNNKSQQTEGNRINSRRYGGSIISVSLSIFKLCTVIWSSGRQRRKCLCGVRSILMTGKKGIHARRQFWRCQLHMKCLSGLMKMIRSLTLMKLMMAELKCKLMLLMFFRCY